MRFQQWQLCRHTGFGGPALTIGCVEGGEGTNVVTLKTPFTWPIAGAVRVIARCPTRDEADEVVEVAMKIEAWCRCRPHFTHMIGDDEQAVAPQLGLTSFGEDGVRRLVPSE
jgi:hypothetical protein